MVSVQMSESSFVSVSTAILGICMLFMLAIFRSSSFNPKHFTSVKEVLLRYCNVPYVVENSSQKKAWHLLKRWLDISKFCQNDVAIS